MTPILVITGFGIVFLFLWMSTRRIAANTRRKRAMESEHQVSELRQVISDLAIDMHHVHHPHSR